MPCSLAPCLDCGLVAQKPSPSSLMIWAFLLLFGVVVAVHWFEYQRSVQEYTFAQPAALGDLRGIQGDKTPIVAEIGALPWRPEVAGLASWTCGVGGEEATAEATTESPMLEMPVSAWLKETPRPPLANPEGLAAEMELTTGLADLDDSRAWWWLPGLRDARVGILEPSEKLGLTWVSEERRWIGCSSGAPLILWLVHSRYRRFLPSAAAGNPGNQAMVDPWALTVVEAPWIGKVQFVEVRVRPGWCVGLPAHWGYAVRVDGVEAAAGSSWWWSASQHSAFSLGLGSVGSFGSIGSLPSLASLASLLPSTEAEDETV